MYKDRQIYLTLEKQKKNSNITILIGPRQVGKTTLLQRLFDQLRNDHRCLFLDLDIYSHYEQVSSYENLINTLKINGYQTAQEELFVLFEGYVISELIKAGIMADQLNNHPLKQVG